MRGVGDGSEWPELEMGVRKWTRAGQEESRLTVRRLEMRRFGKSHRQSAVEG